MMMVLGTSSVMLALSENGYSKNGVVSGIKGAILPKQYALESGLAAVGDMLDGLLIIVYPGNINKWQINKVWIYIHG